MSQQTKSEMVSNGENDRSNFTTNQNIADATKKQKGKQGLQLNMNAQDNGLKVDLIQTKIINFPLATTKNS